LAVLVVLGFAVGWWIVPVIIIALVVIGLIGGKVAR